MRTEEQKKRAREATARFRLKEKQKAVNDPVFAEKLRLRIKTSNKKQYAKRRELRQAELALLPPKEPLAPFHVRLKERATNGDEEAIAKLQSARDQKAKVKRNLKLSAENGDASAIEKVEANKEAERQRHLKLIQKAAEGDEASIKKIEERRRLDAERRRTKRLLAKQGDPEAIAWQNKINEAKARTKEKDRLREAEYRQKPEVKERRRLRHLERMKDLEYSIGFQLRGRLRRVLQEKRSEDTAVLHLGCSIKQLKVHIENQFEEWMSWSNWGKAVRGGERVWNLDHIQPLSSFDLTDPEQLAKACHYTNLRPLCAIENIKKGAKLNYQAST